MNLVPIAVNDELALVASRGAPKARGQIVCAGLSTPTSWVTLVDGLLEARNP